MFKVVFEDCGVDFRLKEGGNRICRILILG